jgi:hypothetical protein
VAKYKIKYFNMFFKNKKYQVYTKCGYIDIQKGDVCEGFGIIGFGKNKLLKGRIYEAPSNDYVNIMDDKGMLYAIDIYTIKKI